MPYNSGIYLSRTEAIMNNTFVVTAAEGGVMQITVDRQEKLNALNRQVMAQLHEAFERAAEDESVRCVTLTGAGDRAFVAGADISEFLPLDGQGAESLIRQGHALMALIESLGKPVIAAINGYALGGGCELALACTLRIASSTAQIGLPEVSLGLMPGYGGTQRLSRLIGAGRALEMMLTGKPVDATKALQSGLVNAVVEPGELGETVRGMAARLARSAPIAMKGIMEAVRRGIDLPLDDALKLEATGFAGLFDTHDMREGTAAFIEKRKPEFTGR